MKNLPWLIIMMSVLFLSGCAQPEIEEKRTDVRSEIRELLKSEPGIVFEILRDNPEQFIEAFEHALNQQGHEAFQEELAYSAVPKDPEISPERPMRGNPEAPVTIVEYSDLLCPHCATAAKNIGEVLAQDEDDVRLVFKHMPLNPASIELALAFEALALQSHELAWMLHDEVFARQEQAGADVEKFLMDFIHGVGADMERFTADRVSTQVAAIVDGDLEEVQRFGIDGAPTFLFNGFAVQGALPVDEFQGIVEHVRPRDPEVVLERLVLGNPNASVTIVMYSDFLCPYCAGASTVVNELMIQDSENLRFMLKHMPIINETSRDLAHAFEALSLQSRDLAWEFSKSVFARQDQVEANLEGFLADFIQDSGADMQKFTADRASMEVVDRVDRDLAEAEAFGYFGVPMFLINGVPIHGLVSKEELQGVIDLVRSVKG